MKHDKTRFIPITLLIITSAISYAIQPKTPQKLISPIADISPIVYAKEPESSPTPTLKTMYEGKVSYYSHEGCLGCNENQIMGNGESFDENAMTIAVPCEDVIAKRVRYNTKVTVTNQDNGKSVEAVITDCGGFSKYGRVADLSKGMYDYLEAKTDKTVITIKEVK